MSETFTPTVITSKRAKQDIVDIRAKHGDILRGMEDQKQRVALYNQQKMEEAKQRQAIQMEQNRQSQEMQAKNDQTRMSHEKDMLAHTTKLKELAIKEKALEQS